MNKKEQANSAQTLEPKISPVGAEIARYKKVPAYQNGKLIVTSHGKHYATDGYYYGQKWQCVEFVKRFYHDAHGHHMPSVWGHACDFFDPDVAHGEMNTARGMRQYRNGGGEAPKPDDLLVFRKGSLGHVAVVTKVTESSIEVIQQNVHGLPTAQHVLVCKAGKYTVGNKHQPAGWLRLPEL
ncbi:CHAP domain-containing protein [Oceaniferula spumae]